MSLNLSRRRFLQLAGAAPVAVTAALAAVPQLIMQTGCAAVQKVLERADASLRDLSYGPDKITGWQEIGIPFELAKRVADSTGTILRETETSMGKSGRLIGCLPVGKGPDGKDYVVGAGHITETQIDPEYVISDTYTLCGAVLRPCDLLLKVAARNLYDIPNIYLNHTSTDIAVWESGIDQPNTGEFLAAVPDLEYMRSQVMPFLSRPGAQLLSVNTADRCHYGDVSVQAVGIREAPLSIEMEQQITVNQLFDLGTSGGVIFAVVPDPATGKKGVLCDSRGTPIVIGLPASFEAVDRNSPVPRNKNSYSVEARPDAQEELDRARDAISRGNKGKITMTWGWHIDMFLKQQGIMPWFPIGDAQVCTRPGVVAE